MKKPARVNKQLTANRHKHGRSRPKRVKSRSGSAGQRSSEQPLGTKNLVRPEAVQSHVTGLFEEFLHSKQVESLTNGVIGVMYAERLSIHAIGHGLAQARGKSSKHAIKQVDRLLSNAKVPPWELFALWVPHVLGKRKKAVVSLDWTNFDADDQATCAAYLITKHGRATPLVWQTIHKSQLEGRQTATEDQLIERLHELIEPQVRLTLLADRGFAAADRFMHLTTLGWDFVIRFRKNTWVQWRGVSRPAGEWVPKGGRALLQRDVLITGERSPLEAVVCVRKPRMKEEWCLATNRTDLSAAKIVKLYGRRFTIEETFRDQKDLRFGQGLSATHIRDCGRRDRLLLLSALAWALLTLLGAAAEAIGYDRKMKANTVTYRTHSLFRQGCYWFGRLSNLPQEQLHPLMQEFERQLATLAVHRDLFGIL